ncbi:MAG: ABC transporter ATP-binding protein [Rhodospirillaceae bacterium]|nr:ABC transporter ATP-binding protein [Rhodospirillaceae bacterium]
MPLELKNVVKKVGADTHIYDTSVELVENQFNILLGTTLAGKTTLMQLMAGLETPTSGEVWFAGKNVTGVPVQKRNVSFVHQQFINYPHFNVYENIASPLRVAKISKKEIEERVGHVADLLKLTPMLGRKPSELSGGQQQRTALARALVKDADLVLLDEPLANLDYKLREELRDELPKLFQDRDCTVVYATTEPTEALLLGGNTATVHEGRITQFGNTSEVYRKPSDLLTAEVFSDPPINAAEVELASGQFSLNGQVNWPSASTKLANGSYKMAIRPHYVTLEQNSEKALKLEGRVLVAELSGSESVVHFEVEGHPWVSQSPGIHAIEVGQAIDFYLDTTQCLYFDDNDKLIAE